jgi:hypothetical protein
MTVTLSLLAGAGAQFFDDNGNPLSGGKIFTYAAGTTTPLATYTTVGGNIAHTNPIVLDAAGRVNEIWLTIGVGYKFVLKSADDVLIGTYDNIPSAAQAPAANDADSIMYEQGYTVTAGNFVIGNTYRILSVGNTDFTLIGAPLNAPGVFFVATGVGSGSGTAQLSRTVQKKLQESISVKDFGAKGDFNPSTGVGTDDRIAIQAALNYAATNGNCQVVFPEGQYYLGTSYSFTSSGLNAQLLLGSMTVTNAANNVVLQGNGAAIYQGAPGCALAIGNASNISVLGLKMVGFVGGSLGSSREFDNLIGIFKSSKFISIAECYITNSLGYTIYTVGDPNVAGGGTADTCLNITIRDSIIKTRYGNGTSSSAGGSKSQWAFAAVDAQNVVLQDNVIYGVLDFEPNNIADQSTYGIFVEGNQFPAGYVTPIVPSGTSTYWADEIIGKSNSGGTPITGGVNITGATGAPLNACNVVSNNSFDNGIINVGNAVYYQWVLGNSFRLGKINVGSTTGGNVNRFYTISGNTSYAIIDATSAFIECKGSISNTQFSNNTLTTTDFPVIGTDGVGGADGGTNNYSNNNAPSCVTNPVINFSSFAATSVKSNNAGANPEILSFQTSLTDGTNSATLSANTLFYRIDGRQITFTGRLFIDTPGSIGADSYLTLPTTANSTTNMKYTVNVSPVTNFSPSANFTGLYGVIDENTNKCFIKQMRTTGIPTGVAAANFSSNAVIIVSGTYFTN